MSSPFGSLVTRPWFDRVALKLGLATYLPLSRAWAAASIAEGSIERFRDEVPIARLSRVAERIARLGLFRVAELSAIYDAVEKEWRQSLFDAEAASPGRLVAMETARRDASDAFMKGRLAFLPLRLQAALPAVRFELSREREVEERYGAALADIADAYQPPDTAQDIKQSASIAGPSGLEYWLRFPSGSAAVGDEAWAHVFEPDGIKDPPTLIYGHGLAVELEALKGLIESSSEIVAQGVRFVRLEAPWHSRRRQIGRYGGEPFMGRAPLGGLDLFAAEVREMAALIAWCRRRGSGRVAVGGTSLGALVSQLVVSHSRNWPKRYRPDAAFLTTTTEDVGGLSLDSSIAKLVGLPQALAAVGWTQAKLDRWRPLTDPLGDPPLAPEDIVMVLGRVDNVTPYARGIALAERWRLPAENLFLRNAGHFSAALDLKRDQAPLHRLVQRLKAE